MYESLPGCRICHVPEVVLSGTGNTVSKFIKDEAVYGSSGFFPGKLAEIDSKGRFRDTPVVRVKVFPFQCNPVTGELRYYRNMRIKIVFEHALPREVVGGNRQDRVFDKLAAKTIINYKKREKIKRTQLDINGLAKGTINEGFLRIEIEEDGIYRLTFNDLRDAGLKPRRIDPNGFQLSYQGIEVAIKVVLKRSNRLNYIEFYGQGMDNLFTNINVYQLRWSDDISGKRVERVDGTLTGDVERVDSFLQTLHFEENITLWAETPGAPDADYWFREKLTAPAVTDYAINTPSVNRGQGEITMRVAFRGRTNAPPRPDHHTLVSLNNGPANEDFWHGDIEYVQELTIPSDSFLYGTNTVTIDLPGDTGAVIDVIYLNWVEVDCRRNLEAVNNRLWFVSCNLIGYFL